MPSVEEHHAGALTEARVQIELDKSPERTLLRTLAFCPTSGFFLCAGTISTSSTSGPLLRVSGTRPAAVTAVCRGATGSISRLLMVHSFSHSCGRRQHSVC